MTTYAVVLHIHVRTPHQHKATLFVTDVPEDTAKETIEDKIVEAGYNVSEFGNPWDNYYLDKLADADVQVKASWNRGGVETVAWENLNFQYD
jgi:hypothetical protein